MSTMYEQHNGINFNADRELHTAATAFKVK